MKKTTVYLSDQIAQDLKEVAEREGLPEAVLIREAVATYLSTRLSTRKRPWPKSIGIGTEGDASVDAADIKDWVHKQWEKKWAERE